jgi:hypothetical protein
MTSDEAKARYGLPRELRLIPALVQHVCMHWSQFTRGME